MASLVIWHKESKEILACMIQPQGSAPQPSVEGTFRHRPDLWDKLESAWIDLDVTTLQAKKYLEIVDGRPRLKEGGLRSG